MERPGVKLDIDFTRLILAGEKYLDDFESGKPGYAENDYLLAGEALLALYDREGIAYLRGEPNWGTPEYVEAEKG